MINVKPTEPVRRQEQLKISLDYDLSFKDLLSSVMKASSLHNLSLDDFKVRLRLDWDDCPEAYLVYSYPESEENFQRRMDAYLKQLAEYEEWATKNAEAIAEHQRQEKERILRELSKKKEDLLTLLVETEEEIGNLDEF